MQQDLIEFIRLLAIYALGLMTLSIVINVILFKFGVAKIRKLESENDTLRSENKELKFKLRDYK